MTPQALPSHMDGTASQFHRHVYHVYAIQTPRRDVLTKLLESRQIQYGIHYPQPIHLSQAHADLGYQRGDFPVSESVCERILSLPIYPELTRSQVEEVAAAVRDAHAD